MPLPAIRGIIDRRILVNYCVDPAVAAAVLPPPFEPQIVQGHAIAGICLIRLTHVRPRGLPAWTGARSENAAHRFAVNWPHKGQARQGVFVPRRDTDSCLSTLVGGWLFPGQYHQARFNSDETDDHLAVDLRSRDGQVTLRVEGDVAEQLPNTSVFANVDDASAFFEKDSLGYSATTRGPRFDGVELCCNHWAVQPLAVRHVRSSYFENEQLFPAGSVTFDHALLMRGIEHEWHTRDHLHPSAALV